MNHINFEDSDTSSIALSDRILKTPPLEPSSSPQTPTTSESSQLSSSPESKASLDSISRRYHAIDLEIEEINERIYETEQAYRNAATDEDENMYLNENLSAVNKQSCLTKEKELLGYEHNEKVLSKQQRHVQNKIQKICVKLQRKNLTSDKEREYGKMKEDLEMEMMKLVGERNHMVAKLDELQTQAENQQQMFTESLGIVGQKYFWDL